MNASSIDQLFSAVQSVIFQLSDRKEYQQTMNGYGFTQKRVQEGSTLLQNAQRMHSTQEEHYDTARLLSAQLVADREVALDTFRRHVSIARSAFHKDPLVLKVLKINKLITDRWSWTKQATDFYNKVPQYMDTLLKFGATQEDFEQNKAAVEALLVLRDRRMQKKGEAEDSTQQKKEAVKALRAWYGEFRKLARIAFKKNPQVLETFGMVVPSAPRKRKATSEV